MKLLILLFSTKAPNFFIPALINGTVIQPVAQAKQNALSISFRLHIQSVSKSCRQYIKNILKFKLLVTISISISHNHLLNGLQQLHFTLVSIGLFCFILFGRQEIDLDSLIHIIHESIINFRLFKLYKSILRKCGSHLSPCLSLYHSKGNMIKFLIQIL